MRHDDADESNRPSERDSGTDGERGADERHAFSSYDVDAACGGGFCTDADEVEDAREEGEAGAGDGHRHQRCEERSIRCYVK